MTPERIAELRQMAKDYYVLHGIKPAPAHESMTHDADAEWGEMLDAIEALTAERDALRDATRWRLVTDTEPAIGDVVEGLWMANTQGDALRSGVYTWEDQQQSWPLYTPPDAWRPFVRGELPPELLPPE
jgi:hypothetical protein